MKNLFFVFIFLFSIGISAQCNVDSVLAFQKQINSEYADPKESPLKENDLKVFKKLDFYPSNLNFCTEAKFVSTPNEKPFVMPTTGKKTPSYVKFGEVYFFAKLV